ncbi:MAG TPA: helix-turn-helix domain-containing protein [Candidatus Limnocylindrales bacterium]|nr:helix-turn-helix domain-containing protein [Candidatus Limnocylindrales bacterium]
MNDVTLGRALRAIRQRSGLRQVDVGRRAGVTQQLVSRIELGHVAEVTVATARKVFAAAGADYVGHVTWRGGSLDRLLDEGHADVVGTVITLLRRRGWTVLTEVTFSQWGERGSIDVLAWHSGTRTLLVVEVKTEITSAEETLRRLDVKVRLAPGIARDRFGASPRAIARLLVVADRSTNRRRVDRLAAVFDGAFPVRGDAVRSWMHAPVGTIDGLLFVGERGGARGRRRVRRAGVPAIGGPP